jgi:hypothetical protein
MIEVICQGSPYDMGRLQGVAVREKIHAAHASLGDLEAFRQQQPWWLPYSLYRRLAQGRANRLLADPLKRCYPEFSQRLFGLADGAGVNPGVPYLFNALEPLLSYIGGSTACPCACSRFAIGAQGADGRPKFRLSSLGSAILHDARVPAERWLSLRGIHGRPASGRGGRHE